MDILGKIQAVSGETEEKDKDYTWLILLIIGVLVIIAILVILGVVTKKKYDEKHNKNGTEKFGNSLNNKPAPNKPDDNFHDISVKYQ